MNYTYSKYLIDKSFVLVILLISSSLSLLGQTPSGFSYTATPMSGTFYGQAQIDDIPASEGDWIGAFDSEGNCAGAVPLTIYEGVAYINLIIYGDDATSLDIDEGMNTGEVFFLRLFDVSNGETYEYQSPLSIQSFDGWYSNNGAPLSSYDNISDVYNWITVDVGFDLEVAEICSAANPLVLANYAFPEGGVFVGPGVEDGIFNPTTAGLGTHTLTYNYSLTSASVDIDVYAFSIELETTNPLCFGDGNGTLEATPFGGLEPISYNYNGADPMALFAGGVTVTATDYAGCIAEEIATLTENDILDFTLTTTDAICYGDDSGTADVSISGGSGEYSVAWSDDNSPSNLSYGSYSVIVQDANGCESTQTFNITQPEELSVTVNIEEVDCAGATSGAISLEISGGTGEYTTDWGGEDPTSLSMGSYPITVFDANGCSVSTVVLVDEPTALSAEITIADVTCNGASDGAAELIINGGTGDISIDWNNENPLAMQAGSYSVSLTDVNGCFSVLNFVIEEPSALSTDYMVTNISCFGANTGTVEITSNGGTGDHIVDLLGINQNAILAGDYNYTVTDDNGCTISNNYAVTENSEVEVQISTTDVSCTGSEDGQAQLFIYGGESPYATQWIGGVDPDNLSGGNHYAEITDLAGCSQTINAYIQEPTPLEMLVVSSQADCMTGKGAISFAASGGGNTYLVNWNGLDLNAVPIGSHNYFVSDENGCEISGSATIYPPDGICGCNIPSASNFNALATDYDGLCEFSETCQSDLNGDGLTGAQDLLELLIGYGTTCD
tara:strand:+ start:1639 stop:3996 length:2358 start_codon:yes stop_codon:yes gene_type:complete